MANLQKSTLSYVRTEMLPQAHPPLRDTGIIKWMRENLFSGVMNTVLTVLGTLAVVLLIYDAFPWFMRSVWVADSLSECRSVIASTWGEGLTGACWAVIRERWMQFLFGFYPIDYNLLANMFYADAYSAAGGREGVFGGDVPREIGQAFADEMRAAIGHTRFYVIGYGRPILTFLLLFVALMPVLYDRIPRQFLWLSAFYPATAFWLLWGGSIWLPVMVMAGFGLVAVAITMVVGRRGMIVAALVGVAVFLVLFSDPVSLLVHDRMGLFASYRGAIGLAERLGLPPLPAKPCDSCADKPCLSACPAAALTGAGYDLAACHDYLDTQPGKLCLSGGCQVRRACPAGRKYGRLAEQSAYHMRLFHP